MIILDARDRPLLDGEAVVPQPFYSKPLPLVPMSQSPYRGQVARDVLVLDEGDGPLLDGAAERAFLLWEVVLHLADLPVVVVQVLAVIFHVDPERTFL